MFVGSLWEYAWQKMHRNLSKNNSSKFHDSVFQELIATLNKAQREISCKFFYDKIGSDLFEQITNLDEYYLTRSEISILNENINEISRSIRQDSVLIELGSGSSKKIRILLENIRNLRAYIPVDISDQYISESLKLLKQDYPYLNIIPLIADYTKPFNLPDLKFEHKDFIVYYPGSTIGNFDPDQAVTFLGRIANLCGKDSSLLIGIDLKKDIRTLELAYNDKSGITAKFNLNILQNINNTFSSNFNLEKWKHIAFYNEDEGRIEMHLQSLKDQHVSINGSRIRFRKDETIHTENSYKYHINEFKALIKNFYNLRNFWTDRNNYFALLHFTAI